MIDVAAWGRAGCGGAGAATGGWLAVRGSGSARCGGLGERLALVARGWGAASGLVGRGPGGGTNAGAGLAGVVGRIGGGDSGGRQRWRCPQCVR